jgi:hypothetical protein
MTTMSVSDEPNGFESRAFECSKCGHSETRKLASDPLKTDALGWLSGELGAATIEARSACLDRR